MTFLLLRAPRRLARCSRICVAAGLALAGRVHGADKFLFDPGRPFEFTRIEARDAKVSAPAAGEGFLLRLDTGHDQRWPGITLPAPDGTWDLSAFQKVALTVKNAGTAKAVVFCRVDNDGADGVNKCANGSVALDPGKTGTLQIDLARAGDNLGGKLFGMRGYPAGTGGGGSAFDPSKVTALVIFVQMPGASHQLGIGDIRATGVPWPRTASVTDASPYFPFIDTFGQYKHAKWPGKVQSAAGLTTRRVEEAKELAEKPEPGGWDKYGGWGAGPRLKSTGYFRTEEYQGKWWLVDPDGDLFFSQGIDCVGLGDTTPVEGRETWFDNFPGGQPEFMQFLGAARALMGYYAGRTPACFSFIGANLLRKYGPDWRQDYSRIAHQRLRSWGLNTIGNWSDGATRLMRLTPYVDSIGFRNARMIEGSKGYWGKFPDVFDPGFAESLHRSMAEKAGKSAGDPWCIGYFSDNEMSWGDETSLGLAALQSPADQPAKKEFLASLEAKYGEIAKLNGAWGADYPSWDALLSSRDAPDKEKAHDDLAAFYTQTAETYFRTARDAIKAAAPHQLYLGCRFAAVNDLAAIAAAKYCDVVSYNLYRRGIAGFQFPGGDKPLLIGEFHFGALDRGLFHPGLVPVANQEERARAYKDYVMGAIRHPLFVGAHWFQWTDEPVTGRVYDEENYQIGFIDVADTPYPEMIAASRQVAAEMYPARAGR